MPSEGDPNPSSLSFFWNEWDCSLELFFWWDSTCIHWYIPINEVKAYPATPLKVKVCGRQVTICIVIIGTSIGAEVPYYHMRGPSLAHHDPLQTIRETFLTKGVLLKHFPKCIAVMHVILIQYDDHSEMCNLLYHNSLQTMEIGVMMPKGLVHRHQVMEIQASLNPPCAEWSCLIHHAGFGIFETSIVYGPWEHWKWSGTAWGLSLGPYPFSKNGQYFPCSVGASGSYCCRCSWNLEKACLNPEGGDGWDIGGWSKEHFLKITHSRSVTRANIR